MLNFKETAKGKFAILENVGVVINNASDYLDIVANSETTTLVLQKGHLNDAFFDLSTGIAGEIVQKTSNYNLRLIIIGDFNSIEKKSLRDFIYESNRTGKILFVDHLEQGIELLR